MNTIIKISTKELSIEAIIKDVYSITKENFDLEVYKACYEGNFENGIKIIFFNTINYKTLENLHTFFISMYSDYSCFYIDNEYFQGCIKEYLYNKGCNVKGIYKNLLINNKG